MSHTHTHTDLWSSFWIFYTCEYDLVWLLHFSFCCQWFEIQVVLSRMLKWQCWVWYPVLWGHGRVQIQRLLMIGQPFGRLNTCLYSVVLHCIYHLSSIILFMIFVWFRSIWRWKVISYLKEYLQTDLLLWCLY